MKLKEERFIKILCSIKICKHFTIYLKTCTPYYFVNQVSMSNKLAFLYYHRVVWAQYQKKNNNDKLFINVKHCKFYCSKNCIRLLLYNFTLKNLQFKATKKLILYSIFFKFALTKVVFFKEHHPSHDNYGKTIDDTEKRFLAFNCQEKKLNREVQSLTP